MRDFGVVARRLDAGFLEQVGVVEEELRGGPHRVGVKASVVADLLDVDRVRHGLLDRLALVVELQEIALRGEGRDARRVGMDQVDAGIALADPRFDRNVQVVERHRLVHDLDVGVRLLEGVDHRLDDVVLLSAQKIQRRHVLSESTSAPAAARAVRSARMGVLGLGIGSSLVCTCVQSRRVVEAVNPARSRSARPDGPSLRDGW